MALDTIAAEFQRLLDQPNSECHYEHMTRNSKSIDPGVEAAYRYMAGLGYRPAAPSDGFGQVVVPEDELNLEDEIRSYSTAWTAAENGEESRPGTFYIGTPSYDTVAPIVLSVEAARLMCGMLSDSESVSIAAKLLRAAAERVEELH